MGLFDRFKNQKDIVKKELNVVPWIPLDREEQLEGIKELSNAIPVLIFKHSITCGISRMVLKQFEKAYDIDEKELEPYFLDLKKHRSVSDLVATVFKVPHESPQVLIIKAGECIYDTSHGGISLQAIKEYI